MQWLTRTELMGDMQKLGVADDERNTAKRQTKPETFLAKYVVP